MHGIWKCSCGALIKQCRCIDKNKPVIVVPNGCPACKAAIEKGFTPPVIPLRPENV